MVGLMLIRVWFPSHYFFWNSIYLPIRG